jgi:hypothetical protein
LVRGEQVDGLDPAVIESLWQAAIDLCQIPDLRARLQSKDVGQDLYRDLFYYPAAHYLGFARGKTDYCNRRNFCFQSIAAFGAKEAVWRLYRAGYEVSLFVHDEVVISLPEDSDVTFHQTRINQVMTEAMAVVVGEIPVKVEVDSPRKAWGS